MNSDLYSEILENFDLALTRKEKIDILRKHGDARFRDFLYYAFSPKVEFDVEIPEYRPSISPAGLNDCYLHQEMPKMYRFIKDHPKRTPGFGGKKQQNILIPILEGLHRDEADLLCRMFKKNLKVKFLTENLVKEAFPDIDL